MKSAVIYARVSSIGDRQNTERQIFDLREYANRNDFQILKTFEEHISGAKKNEDRLVLQISIFKKKACRYFKMMVPKSIPDNFHFSLGNMCRNGA